jgi:hypothetical protein
MRDALEPLLPLILITLGVCCTALWVFMQSNIRPSVKAMLIPGTIAGSLLAPLLMLFVLGHAVKLPLPSELTVLAHQTIIVENKKARIEVWGVPAGGNKTRLYSIPYTKQTEKALEEAAKGRKKGMRSKLKRGDKQADGQNQDNLDGGWELKLEQPEHLKPKEGDVPPEAEPEEPEEQKRGMTA